MHWAACSAQCMHCAACSAGCSLTNEDIPAHLVHLSHPSTPLASQHTSLHFMLIIRHWRHKWWRFFKTLPRHLGLQDYTGEICCIFPYSFFFKYFYELCIPQIIICQPCVGLLSFQSLMIKTLRSWRSSSSLLGLIVNYKQPLIHSLPCVPELLFPAIYMRLLLRWEPGLSTTQSGLSLGIPQKL